MTPEEQTVLNQMFANIQKLLKDVEMVMPGDRIKMTGELISPVAIEQGMRFAIREGGRTIGAGVVSKIIE